MKGGIKISKYICLLSPNFETQAENQGWIQVTDT